MLTFFLKYCFWSKLVLTIRVDYNILHNTHHTFNCFLLNSALNSVDLDNSQRLRFKI